MNPQSDSKLRLQIKIHKEYSKIDKLQEEIWRCGSIFDKSRRSMYELMASDSHRRFVARLAGMSS